MTLPKATSSLYSSTNLYLPGFCARTSFENDSVGAHGEGAGVAASAFRALAEKGINIKAITTSEIKISILIDGAYAELAVRTLHSCYGLDKS